MKESKKCVIQHWTLAAFARKRPPALLVHTYLVLRSGSSFPMSTHPYSCCYFNSRDLGCALPACSATTQATLLKCNFVHSSPTTTDVLTLLLDVPGELHTTALAYSPCHQPAEHHTESKLQYTKALAVACWSALMIGIAKLGLQH